VQLPFGCFDEADADEAAEDDDEEEEDDGPLGGGGALGSAPAPRSWNFLALTSPRVILKLRR